MENREMKKDVIIISDDENKPAEDLDADANGEESVK
jgi:hypothetical protein